MSDWVLRVEGVNLDDTVFNTNDLSTIRGSSLVLEAFGYELEHMLSQSQYASQVKVIYQASSQAAFQIDSMTAPQAAALADDIRTQLSHGQWQGTHSPPLVSPGMAGTPYQILNLNMPSEHMTFVVAVAELDRSLPDGLRRALNKAMVIGHRQKLAHPNLPRSPSHTLTLKTAPNDKIREDVQCRIDPLQQIAALTDNGASIWMNADQYDGAPVVEVNSRGLERKIFSKRSAHLRKYGREARQSLYRVFLEPGDLQLLEQQGLYNNFEFAESVPDISEPTGIVAKRPAALSGKIAVLYVDGNGFTGLANRDPITFPKAVAKIYSTMMNELLTRYLAGAVSSDANLWIHPRQLARKRSAVANPIRLETLFIGGDDACFVLPSWLALDLATFILDSFKVASQTHASQFNATFRAGLAIANDGTPFRRIRNLAYDLMQDAKHAFPPGQPTNALSIQILEGADLRDGSGALDSLRGSAYKGHKDGWGAIDCSARNIGAAFRATLDQHKSRIDGINAMKDKSRGFAKSVLHRMILELDDSDPANIKTQDKRFDDAMELHGQRGENPPTKAQLLSWLPTFGGMVDDKEKDPVQGDVPLSLRLKAAADLWDYVEPLKNVGPPVMSPTGGVTS